MQRCWPSVSQSLLTCADGGDRVSLYRIGPAINLKTAKVPSIDIPATLLRRTAAYSLDGLRAQSHDTVSASTGRVN
jgi:hypothetical protein